MHLGGHKLNLNGRLGSSPIRFVLLFLVVFIALHIIQHLYSVHAPVRSSANNDIIDTPINDTDEPSLIKLTPTTESTFDPEQLAHELDLFKHVDPELLKQAHQYYQQDNSSSTVMPTKQPHYAFINRDSGCQDDFDVIAHHFQFSYLSFSADLGLFKFIPELKSHNFLTEQETKLDRVRALANYFCDTFPIVFVFDTNADGRFLLQKIDEQGEQCRMQKLIFITGNRFDYNFGRQDADMQSYYDLLKRVMKKQEENDALDPSERKQLPRIHWVSTNPWEAKYAEIKLGGDYLKYTLIRRVGYSKELHPIPIPKEDHHRIVLSRHGLHPGFYDFLLRKNPNLDKIKLLTEAIDQNPNTFTQYRALVELPFQSGERTIYANLAEGTRVLIPSPNLLNEIIMNIRRRTEVPPGLDFWGLYIIDFNYDTMGDQWYTYLDYYSDDLKDYFYYFDSYQELENMVKETKDVDSKNIKEKGPLKYAELRQKAFWEWAKLLSL